MMTKKLTDKKETMRQFVDYLRLALGLAPLYQSAARDRVDLRTEPLPEQQGWFQQRLVMEDVGQTVAAMEHGDGPRDFNSHSVRHARRKSLRFRSPA